jgi:hypothetical protein
MSHGTCSTVKIDDGNGSFLVINATDFDAAKHKKFGAKPERKARVAKADR